jgi:hypothetical protein
VTDQGLSDAYQVPTPDDGDEEEARLLDLARRGLIRLGGRVSDAYWALELPEDPTGSVRAALEADRASGL